MPDTLYDEPAYYRMIFRERTADVAFYREACAGASRVLELGAGDGRVSVALARGGVDVVAVERSEPMLSGLEARLAEAPDEVRARVRPVRADARTIRLGERSDRVLVPFNGVAHFHDDADLDALAATARAHLAPGGAFVLDALIPDPALREGAASVPRVVHPRTGRVCRLEERYAHDEATGLLTITTALIDRETGDEQRLTLTLRQRDPDELRAALETRGWRVRAQEDLGDARAFVCAPDWPRPVR